MIDFETLFSNELENSYEQYTEAADFVLIKPSVEKNSFISGHALTFDSIFTLFLPEKVKNYIFWTAFLSIFIFCY